VPVEVDEDNEILDGHHRAEIAGELGINFPVIQRPGMTDQEKLDHVFALNYARRSLSKEERNIVIVECRRRGMSLRAIAKATGVPRSTVADHLSETGHVISRMHLDNPATWPAGFTNYINGRDGKNYPAIPVRAEEYRPRVKELREAVVGDLRGAAGAWRAAGDVALRAWVSSADQMTKYQLFPPLSVEERAVLRADPVGA
jgi:hypothetical protein